MQQKTAVFVVDRTKRCRTLFRSVSWVVGMQTPSLITHLFPPPPPPLPSLPPSISRVTYSSGGFCLTLVGVSTSGAGATGVREPYPIAELLSLLAAFTFAQRSTQGLQRCLRAWAAFVAQATVGEGEGTAGEQNETINVRVQQYRKTAQSNTHPRAADVRSSVTPQRAWLKDKQGI